METNRVPQHNFNLAVGNGVTEEQAADMGRKLIAKTRRETEVRNLEVKIDSLTEQVQALPKVRQLKELKKQLKQKRKELEKATDQYLGGVSTGLSNYLPGKPLSVKLVNLEQMQLSGAKNRIR